MVQDITIQRSKIQVKATIRQCYVRVIIDNIKEI